MKVTTKWLKDFVDFDFSPEKIADKLTLSGTKCENIERLDLDESVIEFELTPNRPDCLSILGIAREISAICRSPLRKPKVELDEIDLPASQITSVKIEAPDLCRRYLAKIIKGVKVKPSPDWLQNRLKAVGMRPINNVVDATNYVLMELGHPLHAFDLNRLEEKRIVVRRAKEGEKITTIDEETKELNDQMLVIADAHKPVAIAGVMGGSETEVAPQTVDLLLESAYFDPINIRKTSKTLKMHTEASHRFERGADIEGLITSINRAAQLIRELAGGHIYKGVVDAYPTKMTKLKVALRLERVNSVLGTDISPEEVKEILKSLEFDFESDESNKVIQVEAPTFRPDISQEIDLIEEIARMYGYDKIPTTTRSSALPDYKPDPILSLVSTACDTLVSCGLCEVLNYSLQSQKAHDLALIPETSHYRKGVKILNPLTEDQEMMRTTLIPSLLGNVSWNLNRHVMDIAIFEISRGFYPTGYDQLPEERTLIAAALSGQAEAKSWNSPHREFDFFDVKGILETLMSALKIEPYSVTPAQHPSFHPGKTGELVVSGKSAGILGEAHPQVLQNFGISQKIFMFEVDLDILLLASNISSKFEPISPFPSIYRDLSVLVAKDHSSEQVSEVIKTSAGQLLRSLRLFDLYVGPQIPEGMKSLAYSMEYHSREKTLTDAEVDSAHQKIISEIKRQLGGTLRF